MVQENNYSDFVERFLLHEGRELYIQPSFGDERRFAKITAGCMGRESWHAIKKLFNLPFLILKVRYQKVSYIGFCLY